MYVDYSLLISCIVSVVVVTLLSNFKPCSADNIKQYLLFGATAVRMFGINTQDTSGFTKLHKAAASGVMWAPDIGFGLNGVLSLHQAGADLNIRTHDGLTALMLAACWGHGDVVKYLHLAGADLNMRSNVGRTAVMEAAQSGHVDIVKYLHQAGADIAVRSDAGLTALRYAAKMEKASEGHKHVVQYLRDAGAAE